MKKAFAFFTLLLGLISMFAQSGPTFPYQAVVRNSQNQLIKDSTFAVDVEIYQGATLKYSETRSVTTNANGQFTMNIGGGAVVSGAMNDIADWSVAKFKLTYHLSGGDIVSENAVSPVPYALQAANVAENASLDCADVINCIADTLNHYTTTTALEQMLQQISVRMDAQEATIDSLRHLVDSLSNLPHGDGDTPTEVADGQPCPGAPTVSDGTNTYNTVKIGNQCWMAQNLRTRIGGDGDKGYPTEAGNDTVTYGRLYTWTAMMKGAPSTNYPAGTTEADTIVHGICPAGWHVPSDAEWTALTDYVNTEANGYRCNGDGTIAKALSQPTGWSSNTNEGCNAGNRGDRANATGFSAVPAGHCFSGGFSGFGGLAYVWSATQYGDYDAWCRILASNFSNVLSVNASKDSGSSVRCLRDAGVAVAQRHPHQPR